MEIQQHEKLQPFLLQQLQELQARDHRELQGAVHEKQLVEQALVSNQRQQQLQQEPEQKQNLLLRESKKGKSKKAKNPKQEEKDQRKLLSQESIANV